MTESLSHVLIAFAPCTAAGWGIGWLDRRWVAVGMVGAILPDLNRIGLLLDDAAVERALGVPFDWGGLHTLGGVLLLVAGGSSHLVIDSLKAWADGSNGAYLYPLSWWRNPTPGWYVSADRRVVVVAVVVAGAVWLVDQYVNPAWNLGSRLP